MAYEGTNYGAPCTCCPDCNNVPCDGAAAMGPCDHICWCDDVSDDELMCQECGEINCDGFCAGSECGRWDQSAPGGMLPVGLCRLGGTEQCDFECPYRS